MILRFTLVVLSLGALTTRAHAESCPIPGFTTAAFGDAGVAVQNGNTDSWDSTLGPYGTSKCSLLGPCLGGVETNNFGPGGISVGPNGSVSGQCTIGAGGTTANITPNSNNCAAVGSQPATIELPVPTLPAGVTPLGAVASSLTISQPGSYSMTSLALSGNETLTVTAGPVVIYLTGADNVMKLSGNAAVSNTTLDPTKLIFMCTSTATTQTLDVVGNGNAYFAIYCPKADIEIAGNGEIFGAVVGKTVSFKGNNGFIHYDKSLASVTSAQIPCVVKEISRATPIVTAIAGQTHVVQGTVAPATTPAKTITTVADVEGFEFPHLEGHLRARLASTVTTSSTSFASGTITLDAAKGIPPVNPAGCALGTNSSFSASCRNVFTTSTTLAGSPMARLTLFEDANASELGAKIAPAGSGPNQVPNIGATEWKTIVRRVLAGKSGGTAAALGGIDRSTVAVVGPSAFAGSTRPTMIYFGGADGMLHAVCASTGGATASQSDICPTTRPDGSAPASGTLPGTELWAFVPRVQLPLIRVNKQRIDGSVRVVDAFGAFPDPATGAATTTRSWRTILTFQTGFSDAALGGGAGVYAIDISDPARPIVLWEYTGAQLGAGLTMHAGPTLIGGRPLNLAVAATNNGSGGAGLVITALALETGVPQWSTPFSYVYANPRPGGGNYDGQIPVTGVPGGVVGADLVGSGFTSDLYAGDLQGNLWRLDAATGANRVANGKPLFSFSTDRHPIGAIPAIVDNGVKLAVFASGAYADPAGTPTWTTTGQFLIGVALTSATPQAETTAGLPVKLALGDTSEKVSSQLLVVGSELFLTTDTTDPNSAEYGIVGAQTGAAYRVSFGASSASLALISRLQGGASSLAFDRSNQTLVGGAADRTQRLTGTASTTGTKVDYQDTAKLSRLLWLGP